MLYQFTFRNFRSYKNETVFDLQAVSSQGFNESLLYNSDDNNPFLPVSVIYGPNGGGKSNVLKALFCVNYLITLPVYIFEHQIMSNHDSGFSQIIPFAFDDVSAKQPTDFELFFSSESEYDYKYNISVLDGVITQESLYRKKRSPKSRIAMVFERSAEKIELGACFTKKSINTKINSKLPFLSSLKIGYSFDFIDDIIMWFQNSIMVNYANPIAESKLWLAKDDNFKSKLITLMNDAGIPISNYEIIKESDNPKSSKILFEHTVNGHKYNLNINQESDGTRKLFAVLPHVIMALSDGRLIAFDELDAKLHPKLLKFIVMLFKNPEINKKNAQLIFTSHDVSTMKSSVFRTDEIWFACKLADESSDLYSLYEIRDENNNRISPLAAFDKQYLEGRYGADPYFTNMMNWK